MMSTPAIQHLERLAEELATHPPEDGDTIVLSGASYAALQRLGGKAEHDINALALMGTPYVRKTRPSYHVCLDLTVAESTVWLGHHGRREHPLAWRAEEVGA